MHSSSFNPYNRVPILHLLLYAACHAVWRFHPPGWRRSQQVPTDDETAPLAAWRPGSGKRGRCELDASGHDGLGGPSGSLPEEKHAVSEVGRGLQS